MLDKFSKPVCFRVFCLLILSFDLSGDCGRGSFVRIQKAITCSSAAVGAATNRNLIRLGGVDQIPSAGFLDFVSFCLVVVLLPMATQNSRAKPV